MTTITTADRAAAAELFEASDGTPSVRAINALLGRMDDFYTAQAFARHRERALEQAALIMENLCFFTDVEELIGMTKQEMSVRTCHEGAAAIRALKGNSDE